MIEAFVKCWDEHKDEIEEGFRKEFPSDYSDIVEAVVTMLHTHIGDYDAPDPKRIHKIDDGDYQGTLLFVVPSGGYQPSKYWAVKVYYGSCSGCDTLQDIVSRYGYAEGEENETDQQAQAIKDLMTLALHIIQDLKEI